MPLDPKVLERLETKLDLGRSQVNKRIAARAQELMLPREQAALALALESGININRWATPDDWAAIRGAATQAAPTSTPAPTQAAPIRRATARKAAANRSAKKAAAPTRSTRRPQGNKVFVVHGRDAEIRKAMYRFLRALGIEPIEWNKAIALSKRASPYNAEIVEAAFKDAQAVVVLMTPDDKARLRSDLLKNDDGQHERRLTGQARPNVLFEAGMAFGTHPDRTVLVEVGTLRPFSDVAGRHVVRLTNHIESRRELATKLENAGCKVDTSGTDWLQEGDFKVKAK